MKEIMLTITTVTMRMSMMTKVSLTTKKMMVKMSMMTT